MATQTASTPTQTIASGTWTVDPANSKVGFAVKHLWGLGTVRGSFDRFTGNLVAEGHGAGGQLVIDADSLDTGNPKRDEHLRSSEFFHVENHPEVVFTPASITSAANGVTVSGDLQIGSTVQRLTLPVDVEQVGERLRIRAATSVTRESAGLTWNRLGMIRGDADLTLDLELTRDDT